MLDALTNRMAEVPFPELTSAIMAVSMEMCVQNLYLQQSRDWWKFEKSSR